MKKSLLLLVVCFLAFQNLQAQVKAGIRGGMSSMDVVSGNLIVTDAESSKQFDISVADANYGIHMGFFAQAKIGRFYIQPEVLFNSSSVNYNLKDFSGGQVVDVIKKESFQNLDLPIMLGLDYGLIRLQGGPVAHVHLNSTSELFDIDGYGQKFDEMTWGYQAGIGLDLWKLMIDVKYEGNFNNFGDHITFFGEDFNFDRSPGRVIASVGISF